ETRDPGSHPSVVVLVRGVRLKDEEEKALRAWVEQGGTVVSAGVRFADDRFGLAEPDPKSTTHLVPPKGAALGAVVVAPAHARWPNSPNDAVRLLMRGDAPYAVQQSIGSGRVVAFADGRLFSNIALAFADNAAFFVALFSQWVPGDVELVDAVGTLSAR